MRVTSLVHYTPQQVMQRSASNSECSIHENYIFPVSSKILIKESFISTAPVKAYNILSIIGMYEGIVVGWSFRPHQSIQAPPMTTSKEKCPLNPIIIISLILGRSLLPEEAEYYH